MEKESFEDPAVAALLNRYFIAIKVDREERPDIDALYMQAARMISGAGGWPLNLLLTPDKKPFFATTYMPREGRFGRMGLVELAQRVGVMWQQDRQRIEASADSIDRAVVASMAMVKHGTIDATLIDRAYRETARRFHISDGGFGDAPRFPSPHRLLFLLRYGVLKHYPEAITMVRKSLTAMQRGGIHDQLGGGFHRYSTDAAWFLPHFEKMLSDQAMLMMAYAEAWQVTGDDSFAATARDIAAYLLRDMHDQQGGFYSAEDADSEGEEGRFYLWKAGEIRQLLGRGAASFMQAYGVEPDGNIHEATSDSTAGMNILHQTGRVDIAAFSSQRATLLRARDQRIRPFRDDKVLSSWNGLTIAALALTGRILHEPRYVASAAEAADFVLNHMRREDGGLLHSWRQGRAAITGQLEDYSGMVWGLIELYESSFDARWLESALSLNRMMLARFQGEGGALYQIEQSDELIARPLDGFDGALPSGNAVAAHNLLRLSHLTGDTELERAAAAVTDYFSDTAEKAPSGVLHLLSALLLAESRSREVVLTGDRHSAGAAVMLKVLQEKYRPNTVVLWRDDATVQIAPYIRMQKPVDGVVTAYVCEHYSCKLPGSDPEIFRKLLDE